MEPPAPKCTDVAAIPNTDMIYQLFASIEPTKHENVQEAYVTCGIPVIFSYQFHGSRYGDRFTLESYGMGPTYGLHNGKYYGGHNNGGFICDENYFCSTIAGEGYVDFIDIGDQYCCKRDAFSSGSWYALSELKDTNKCKPRPNSSYTGSTHRTPYYYCSRGTLSGTKCYSEPKFTCPTDYKLVGEHYYRCVSTKTKCPEGYKLDEIKDEYEYSCIGTKYTCPTNFDYTLSGDKCLCKKK